MTILDMGHGGLHAYVVNDRSTVAEAHGVQHRYVTAGHRAATLDPRVAPWGAAIHRAQNLMRGQFPELDRSLPNEQSPRSHALRQILRANGYHGAENAFVMTHPHPEWRRSSVVSAPDQFGDYHAGIALHPEQNNYGTLTHEAGHLLHHQAAGIDAMDLSDHDDELKHGPGFAHHYQRALQAVSPPAAEFFGTVLPRVKRTIDMANGQHQAGWSTPEQFARERPHGAAVNRAQEAARREAPTMGMDLGKSEDATSAVQHMMRRGGHPDADEAFVMKHPNPGWGQSQAFFSDGQPGISLHPDRWDYGTAAHEVAHHLHEVELGHHPRSDEEAHGPDFVRHYQNVLGDFGPDAARVLGETYHQSLNRLRRMTAAASPFTFSHEEQQIGGMRHPVQVDLHAHHPDSDEPVGTLRYFPPKRRGGPVTVDNLNADMPGAGSALLNEMESRHPGSSTRFPYAVKKNNNNPDVTGHAGEHAGNPSDWDTHHPNLAPELHRGLALTLPSHSARVVNSSAPKEEHLAELHAGLAGSAMGTHWTENERSAQQFAHNAVSDYRTTVPVVVHARTPQLKDIETRREHLYRGGVFPYGDPHSPENEVPVRKGRSVTVTGLSWRPDAPHPDADENGWVHHTYDEPMQHKAVTDKWPPYLTERPDEYGDLVPANVSRHNPRGPVGTEEDAHHAGWAGPYYHGTSKRRARDIRQNGFRQPRIHNWEMADYGTQEEVDAGNTHRTFFTPHRDEAEHFARAQHGDNGDVVTAYLHPDHLTTDEGGGFMDSTQVKDVAHAMAIRPARRTAAIRMVPPDEYRQFRYPDYPRAKTPDSLVRHFKKTSPEYYDKIKRDVQENGFTTPVLARWNDPRGKPLRRPELMEGHHRAAVAHELGIHLPVGDYDNEADYNTAFRAGQDWWRTNQRPTDDMPRQAAFTPTKRLFGPTQGLDHRLFDGEHLKGDVREYIISTLSTFWEPLFGECGWEEWAIVYFAGSEASEWTSSTLEGNNDFDVLIGVDYQKFRGWQSRTSKYQTMTDEEITADLNKGLRVLDEQTAAAMIPVDGILTGPWSNTWYVNQDSHDIRNIKPYAAYDVTHDRWAVKPPHLTDWSLEDFPEGHALVQEARAVAAYVRAILKLPEPYRTQQGFALWNHLHSDRSRAFGPNGEGWFDPGNVLEKWLDQAGLWEKLVEIMVRAREHPESLNTPAGWSNDPRNRP